MIRRGALIGLGLVALAGCTIEPRADTRGGSSVEADSAAPDTASAVAPGIDQVVASLSEALRVGDGARILTLGAAGLTLVDQEEGIVWTAADPGARLPGALAAADEAGGLGWTLVDRRVSSVGGARLVVSRYRADIAGESMGWWAVETLLLVEEDGRWRVRHLHRSRGPLREGAP